MQQQKGNKLKKKIEANFKQQIVSIIRNLPF